MALQKPEKSRDRKPAKRWTYDEWQNYVKKETARIRSGSEKLPDKGKTYIASESHNKAQGQKPKQEIPKKKLFKKSFQ